jgi:hypothetical protein
MVPGAVIIPAAETFATAYRDRSAAVTAGVSVSVSGTAAAQHIADSTQGTTVVGTRATGAIARWEEWLEERPLGVGDVSHAPNATRSGFETVCSVNHAPYKQAWIPLRLATRHRLARSTAPVRRPRTAGSLRAHAIRIERFETICSDTIHVHAQISPEHRHENGPDSGRDRGTWLLIGSAAFIRRRNPGFRASAVFPADTERPAACHSARSQGIPEGASGASPGARRRWPRLSWAPYATTIPLFAQSTSTVGSPVSGIHLG